MNMRVKNILIFLGLFLVVSSAAAQQKEDARVEARQHYLKGKEYYSQGRYEEAKAEFEKGIDLLIPPRIQFTEGIKKEAEKAIVPAPSEPPKKKVKPLKEKEVKEEEKKAGMEEVAVVPVVSKETAVAEGEREYYLDIGDVLDISVWQVPDLSRSEVIIRPDGKISFPLIGDVKAEGMTLSQLDDIITEKLKTFVKSPEVSIMIRRFGEQRGTKVVILGEVLSPGIYKFDEVPTITEVIASSGGYTKYAVLNSIMVIRGDIKGKPEVIRLNVAQILKSGNLLQNILLKPNDIIYVPRSFIGKVNVFLELIQPAINEYMQTLNARQLNSAIRRKGGI